MARKARSSDRSRNISLDVFEAIKRARMHHGYFPAKLRASKSKIADADNEESSTTSESTQPESGTSRARQGAPPPGPATKKAPKLADVAHKAHDILFKANTVFPFTLFPDTVTIDREKITIANRIFFSVAKISSIPIRDILSVEADTGPFFGSVRISSRFFDNEPHTVNFFWRDDAIKLQHLLQGYIIAHEQEIDCVDIGTNRLIGLLNDLGRGDTA